LNRHVRAALATALSVIGSDDPTAVFLELGPQGEDDKLVTLRLATASGLVRCFIHRTESPRVQVERTAWINVRDVETSARWSLLRTGGRPDHAFAHPVPPP
jgi:hypothetical protein